MTEDINREALVDTVHTHSSSVVSSYFNNASDDELLENTEELIIEAIKMIPYYRRKEFRITLANIFHW